MATAELARQSSDGVTVNSTLDAAIAATPQSRQSIVASAAERLGVPASKVCDLLRNVWKPSRDQQPFTDQEMFVGLSMIARYDLDPIAREVYVSRAKDGRLFTIVGIDGWVKIVHRTNYYDGFTVHVEHDKDGKLAWVDVSIHSKKHSYPFTYRGYYSEYARHGGFVAASMPSHMLRIFAFRHAARYFAPVGGGVVTEEEFAAIDSSNSEQPRNQSKSTTAEELQKVLDAAVQKQQPPATPTQELPAWDRYAAEIASCDVIGGLTLIYDRYFGSESTIEWTAEEDAEARTVRDSRAAELRASRGGKK